MTGKEQIVLNMIKENKNLNEIAKEIWESPKQVHNRINKLINDGYMISSEFYDDGNIRYVLKSNDLKHTIRLHLDDTAKFNALVISDIHIGNELENLSYLYKVYDYARYRDINIILNCGDVIDGSFSKGNQNITDIDKQIDKVITHYPYDKHILNIICFGNHDFCSVEQGHDIGTFLNNRRPDLIDGGYGFTLVNIGNDQFVLKHPLPSKNCGVLPHKLILQGHHHKMLLKLNSSNFTVCVPPLSDLCFSSQENPGFVEMNLSLENGYIYNGLFKQMSVRKKIEVLSECSFDSFFKKSKLDEKKLILH